MIIVFFDKKVGFERKKKVNDKILQGKFKMFSNSKLFFGLNDN